MKYHLVLLASLGLSMEAYSQSSLYQTSPQQKLDHNLALFDKQLFSASIYDNTRLLEKPVNSGQAKAAELNRAMSALEIESPDGPGLMKSYIYDHGNDPSVTTAGLYLGDHFFFKRNFAEAIDSYKLVDVEKLPLEQQAEVLFKQGYSHFQLNQYAEAAPYFDKGKALNQQASFDSYYYSGFIAMENGNTGKAIADLQTASQSPYYANKVPYLLAALYYKQGSYDQLISYAEPKLTNGQNLEKKDLIYLYLAEAYYAKKNFPKAAENYDAFINSRPSEELGRNEIYKAGISQFEIKNYQRATDYLKVSASSTDEIGQASSYYLAHSYLKLENYQFASTSFQSAAKSDFNPAIKEESIFNYAKVNLQKGSFQDAITALDEYVENYPSGKYRAEAENLLSEALVNTNDYLRAIDQMDRITNKSPRIQEAYQKVAFYQAMVYYRDQKWNPALAYLDKSLKFPVDKNLVLDSYFWKGEISSAADNLPQAIKSYEQVLSNRPSGNNGTVAKTYYGLGYAYFNTQQYSKAEDQFRRFTENRQIIANKQQYDDALLRLGDCYYVQKRFGEAASTFQRAINEGNSGVDYAYYRLAVVQNFQSRNQEALGQLDVLISRYPNSLYYEDALFQRGQIYMEETSYQAASVSFSDLLSSKPNSPFVPFALEGRAVANFSLQNYDQTIKDYSTILNNHPNSENAETALKGLQETLALQGRSGEFSDYLTKYKGANPSNGSVQSLEFEAAKGTYFDKNYSQAIRGFENYLKSYPQSAQRADALYFLGDSYMQVGDTEKALAQFKTLENEPASPQRLRAMQKIGVIELERGNFAQAIPYLETSVQNARSKPEEAEAVQGLMIANFETRKYQQSITQAERLATLDGVIPESSPKALLIKAKSQNALNQKPQAELTLTALVADYKTEQGAEGLYLLALASQEKGEITQSNELIFDQSGPFVNYDYWYGRIFLLLADNYVKSGEEFQAKATLESIVENSTNAEIKEMAQSKLQTLK
ncbi:tetratricopeptide repeat protein [Algoriphagus winogradskyi]|uniref:Tetratricopeptide repeat-containing protein n=1 Tax=Algoriphagus winogradskyi TaxID=237017 RepID=A0ABY1N968_9BACT|nr:tetratricopeptide repeat protein [Algoriphagus winogradskyi]SMP03975.1 Tetratricopeptide repeat-containing protein [Algoriphagus winogradskyi]